MDPKELTRQFNLQMGKTKCSDNPYHDSANCSECKVLSAAAEERRQKELEESAASKEKKEEAREADKEKREEEEPCKGNPCTKPSRQYLG